MWSDLGEGLMKEGFVLDWILLRRGDNFVIEYFNKFYLEG